MAWFGRKSDGAIMGKLAQRKGRSRRAVNMFQGGEFLEDRRLLAFDPSPAEQAHMEHLNRMRTNPQSELALYFKTVTPSLQVRDAGGLANNVGLQEIQRAIDHFDVVGSTLQSQFAALTAVPPLAWNEALITAADGHNGFMLSKNEQAHHFPPEEKDLSGRLTDAGYNFTLALENVFAYAENTLYGHAGFSIDWGDGPGGIQSPAGHRDNIMNAQMQEVGISVLEHTPADPDTDVGPMLITQDFGRRSNYQAQLLGVIWEDGFQDTSGVGLTGIYDEGEGYGGLTITAQGNGQIFTTTSMSAGGYQMVIPPGTYTVTVKGASAFSPFPLEMAIANVVVSTTNQKVDFEARSINATGNRRGTAANDTAQVNENQSSQANSVQINVLANDTDPGGSISPSTVSIWTQPAHGSVIVGTNGVVTYTPAAGYSGQDTFKYVVADNLGAFTAPAEVTITVNDVNSAPVATSSSFTAAPGVLTLHDISSNVTDSDGTVNWPTLEFPKQPDKGTVTFNPTTRTFSYTANTGATGTDTFRYRVMDNSGAQSNIAEVTVTINASNVAPVAVNDRLAVVAGIAKILNVTANDTDSDSDLSTGSVTITSGPSNGAATVSGVGISYTSNTAFRGADTIRYRVNDGEGGTSAEATVTVFVTDPLSPWKNPVLAFDVDPNGLVSPLDAIIVINLLSAELDDSMPIPGFPNGPPPFLDVDGNRVVGPLDALLVINNIGMTTGAVQAPLSSSVARAASAASTDSMQSPVATTTTNTPPVTLRPVIRVLSQEMTSDHVRADRFAENHGFTAKGHLARAVSRRTGQLGPRTGSQVSPTAGNEIATQELSDVALSQLYK